MKANQAKQSVEDTKRLLAEKNFRNKQERDRRVRELNSNNMKKFIEERKRLANKHSQETSLLLKISKEEQEALKEENTKVSFECNNNKNLLIVFCKCVGFSFKKKTEYFFF